MQCLQHQHPCTSRWEMRVPPLLRLLGRRQARQPHTIGVLGEHAKSERRYRMALQRSQTRQQCGQSRILQRRGRQRNCFSHGLP